MYTKRNTKYKITLQKCKQKYFSFLFSSLNGFIILINNDGKRGETKLLLRERLQELNPNKPFLGHFFSPTHMSEFGFERPALQLLHLPPAT